MKIAQFAPTLSPVPPLNEGGTERVIQNLCQEHLRMGHEVTLFAPDGSHSCGELVSPGPSVLAREKAPPSLPSALEAISLGNLIERIDTFDVVHCHTEFFHIPALSAWRNKVLTTLHWRTDEADRQEFYGRYADANVVAISKSQASQFSGKGLRKVIHHGIDETLYSVDKHDSNYFAFIGRMTDQKRPDVAISLAKECRKRLKLAGGIDAGNPSYFEEMVAPHVGDEIEYLGAVGDEPKAELLRGAKALLFPIDWDEPFGLVMIEAMACGCPVIAWNRGSVPEVVEDGVTGFIVDSIVEAKDAIARVETLDRESVRQRFEQRFTARRMASDYLDVYRALMASH